jgi:hypothetical protein
VTSKKHCATGQSSTTLSIAGHSVTLHGPKLSVCIQGPIYSPLQLVQDEENCTSYILTSNHNCTGNPIVKPSQASRLDGILGAFPTVLKVGPNTTSSAIIDAIKLHYKQLVPKQQA